MGPVALPELSAVYWRPRLDVRSLVRAGRLWTLSTVAQVVPFVGFAIFLAVAAPVTLPVSLIALVHAWMIPELYAARGAGVVRPRPGTVDAAESRALGMLADLIDRRAYELHQRSGLVLERGALGVWLIAQAGAVLIRPGGRRVHCYCVAVRERDLPGPDRVAHLLLALRCDEAGFATVANLAFSGAAWRLRRRLPKRARVGLDAGLGLARSR
ncbi:MAG TPA: hypothetical protein VGH45_03670 [Solirubrobacteraceae bacterium]|jgi:hypothetical protein